MEPYTVGFYMRAAGADWGWCYLDHEAGKWRNVEMVHDPASDEIIIVEQGIRKATLDRKRRIFTLNHGSNTRGLPAPQDDRDPEYLLP